MIILAKQICHIDKQYENFSFYLDMYVFNHKDVDH
jgi:hypothetical protein